jgi:chromosome segregation ATPase
VAADALDVRMARLEGSYEQLDKRLGDLAAEVHAMRAELRGEIAQLRGEMRHELAQLRGEMRQEIGQVRGEIGSLRAEMSRLFYWLMGTFLAVLTATAGIIVTILLRT